MNMLKQQMAPAHLIEEPCGRNPFCLTGLYMLTGKGELARFDNGGSLIVDNELSESLSFRLQAVLDQYRGGAVDDLAVGLIVDGELAGRWQSATFFVNQGLLDGPLDAESAGDAAPTRHRACTIRQGITGLLERGLPDRRRASVCCPVLFMPEIDTATLRERYGVDLAVNQTSLEVLDLAAPFVSSNRPPHDLLAVMSRMRGAMHEDPGGDAPVADDTLSWTQDGTAGRAEPWLHVGNDCVFEPPDASCFNDGDAVTGWLLEWFSPFNELTDMQREIIAGYEAIRKLRRGTRLVEQGSREDVCVYLLEGSLALRGPDGARIIVKAGTRRSRLPISVLNPHVYEVTAASDVTVILFSQRLIRRIIEIVTTYTSVEPGRVAEDSTAVISNSLQALYLGRTYSLQAPPD